METKPSLNLFINQLHTDLYKDDTEIYTILREITLRCKEEMENKCLTKPIEDYVERVSHYTGVPKQAITEIISKDLQEINYKDKHFELNDRIKIFECLANMHKSKETASYKNLLGRCTDIQMNFSQFRYMMSCLKIEYHKVELGQEILVEDPDLTFERYLYLKQINNFRSQCAPIFYISEVFIDSTFTYLKPWVKDIDVSTQECNGYVFFHAVSKEGFLNGFFCCPTTNKDFVKWITNILLPQLLGPSIIVMDKNDLHGSTINTISKYHSRTDMLQYLRENDIPCNENLHKAELYRLITKCMRMEVSNDVDKIFKAHGHHVLRLPSSFHDLSMTHFLWKHIRDSELNLCGNIELHQIKNVLLERLSCIPQDLWDSFHNSLIKCEKEISYIDLIMSESLEMNYNFNK